MCFFFLSFFSVCGWWTFLPLPLQSGWFSNLSHPRGTSSRLLQYKDKTCLWMCELIKKCLLILFPVSNPLSLSLSLPFPSQLDVNLTVQTRRLVTHRLYWPHPLRWDLESSVGSWTSGQNQPRCTQEQRQMAKCFLLLSPLINQCVSLSIQQCKHRHTHKLYLMLMKLLVERWILSAKVSKSFTPSYRLKWLEGNHRKTYNTLV